MLFCLGSLQGKHIQRVLWWIRCLWVLLFIEMALRQERTDYHLRTCVHTTHSCMHTHLQTHEPIDNHKHNHNTPMPL